MNWTPAGTAAVTLSGPRGRPAGPSPVYHGDPITYDRHPQFAAGPRPAWTGSLPYAVRTAVAAMAALYAAMWLQLDMPRWAVLTVMVVSPPGHGAAIRKTVARVIGTALGCLAAVALAGLFPQDRVGYTLGLGLWIGGCGYWSTARRGFAEYGARLAGFTAAIVAAATASQPQTIFATAVDRGSATIVGIVFALVAAAAASRTDDVPGTLADQVCREADPLLGWAADRLTPGDGAAADAPFAGPVLGLNESILNAMADRPAMRRARPWVAGLPTALLSLQSAALAAAEALPAAVAADDAVHRALLRVRDVVRPGSRLSLHQLRAEADRLADERPASVPGVELVAAAAALLAGLEATLTLAVPARPVRTYPPLAFAPDRVRAWKALTRIVIGVCVGFLVWDVTAWPSGTTFLTNLAVTLILVVPAEDPLGSIRGLVRATLVGVVVGTVAQYVLMPVSDGFGWLAAVCVPLLALTALGQTYGPTATIALGYNNGLIVGLNPTNPQHYDLAASVELAVATVAGTLFTALLYTLIAPEPRGADRAARVLDQMRTGQRAARRLGVAASRDRRLEWETQAYEQLHRVQVASADPADRRAAVDLLLAGRAAFAGGQSSLHPVPENPRVPVPAP